MSFKITTPTGKYKVSMRAGLAHIKSEKKLKESIQSSIEAYRKKPGWERYADRIQELLDGKDYLRIAADWGLFTGKERLES